MGSLTFKFRGDAKEKRVSRLVDARWQHTETNQLDDHKDKNGPNRKKLSTIVLNSITAQCN